MNENEGGPVADVIFNEVSTSLSELSEVTPTRLSSCMAALLDLRDVTGVAVEINGPNVQTVNIVEGTAKDTEWETPDEGGVLATDRYVAANAAGDTVDVTVALVPGHSVSVEVMAITTARLIASRADLLDAKARLAATELRIESLSVAGVSLTRSIGVGDTVDLILDQLASVVTYDSASVMLLKDGMLEVVACRGLPETDTLGRTFDPSDLRLPNHDVIAERQVINLTDPANTHPRFDDPLIRSWLGVPMEYGGNVFGMITVDSWFPNFYDDGDSWTVAAFATHAAVALMRADAMEELNLVAQQDALTGLANRRALMDLGTALIDQARIEGTSVAVLMVDIDHFKKVNDTHGHRVGDEVLVELATRMSDELRAGDMVGRVGGEEFCVVLPGADRAQAIEVGQRLRARTTVAPIETSIGDLYVTLSLGAVARIPREDESLAELMEDADRVLYRAKRGGRDRLELALFEVKSRRDRHSGEDRGRRKTDRK